MLKITKFGGSSCASAEQFRKVKAIIEADPSRRFVVISAAGRKTPKDNKLTDLLYLCRAHIEYHVDCQPVFDLRLRTSSASIRPLRKSSADSAKRSPTSRLTTLRAAANTSPPV